MAEVPRTAAEQQLKGGEEKGRKRPNHFFEMKGPVPNSHMQEVSVCLPNEKTPLG